MQRSVCLTRCTEDNFPKLTCKSKKVKIEYNGVEYENFYEYPNPNRDLLDFSLARQQHYDMCKDMIRNNPRVPQVFSMGKAVRQWRVHTCFEPCRREDNSDPAFTVDERPLC